jgi:hypothetical protein
MSKLDRGLGNAVGLAEVDDSLHRGFLGIVPETSAAGNDSSHLRNVGCFRENQPCPAHRDLAQVHQVPVVHLAVTVADVLAHWRHDDTVL